jgi:hypothetical protein
MISNDGVAMALGGPIIAAGGADPGEAAESSGEPNSSGSTDARSGAGAYGRSSSSEETTMDRLTSTHVPDRRRPGLRLPLVAATLGIVFAACTSAASSTAPGSAASGTAATGPVASTEGGEGGANEFEGSLTSSGPYSATWTVSPDQEVTPFTVGVTLVSDKGTFGNISVSPEGNVSFGSGVPELSGQFTGTGAMVTLDPNEFTGNRFVCAFTVDTDLTSRGVVLHLAGSLTVHWHPSGLGGINCP